MVLSAEDKAFMATALEEVRQETVDIYSVTISTVTSSNVVDEEFDTGTGRSTREVTIPSSPTYSDVPVSIVDVNQLMLATSPRFTPYLDRIEEEGILQDVAYLMRLSQDYSIKEEDIVVHNSVQYRITRVMPDEIGVQNVAFIR